MVQDFLHQQYDALFDMVLELSPCRAVCGPSAGRTRGVSRFGLGASQKRGKAKAHLCLPATVGRECVLVLL